MLIAGLATKLCSVNLFYIGIFYFGYSTKPLKRKYTTVSKFTFHLTDVL